MNANLRDRLHRSIILLPLRIILSLLYAFAVWVRNRLYDLGILKTFQVKTPVISVGNISAGGSGKTVLIQALISHFKETGKHPAVLSRGYGRSSSGLQVVADKSGVKRDVNQAGDEPFMIAMNHPGVPVVVAEDRVLGARFLEDKFAPDIILLDDGFQHRRLHRDLNILLVDQPDLKRDHLLPWGGLREPAGERKRADITIFTKAGHGAHSDQNLHAELGEKLIRYNGDEAVPSDLEGPVGVFSGIGKPYHFLDQIKQRKVAYAASLIFPDHASYRGDERQKISAEKVNTWITTQKDFVKIDPKFCRENDIHYWPLSCTLPKALLATLKHHFK